MLITLVIINTIFLIYLVYKSSNIYISFQSLFTGLKSSKESVVESSIEVPNAAEERITAYRARMKGVVEDRDGLYDVLPPLVQTEFTGTEIITPSMEVQSDRRF